MTKPARRDFWTKQRIVERIRVLERRGNPIAPSTVPRRLYDAAVYHLGSWQAALAAAGFASDDRFLYHAKYSKHDIAVALRRMQREHPDASGTDLDAAPFASSMRALFGTIASALRAAGISDWPVRRAPRAWSRKELIAEIRRREKLGLPLRGLRAARYYFGDVDGARRAAGLPAKRRKRA